MSMYCDPTVLEIFKEPEAPAKPRPLTLGRQHKAILAVLQEHHPRTICLQHIRTITGIENVKGRISDIRNQGYYIEGAETRGLCPCHKSQLYRLVALDPVRPPRRVVHGGRWTRNSYEGLSVQIALEGILDEAQAADLAKRIRRVIQDFEEDLDIDLG